MITSLMFLAGSLALILVAAEFFTNGVEGIGKRFSLSQAVVGSVLAAVGTALPETILPIVAIFFGSAESGKEIGVGAILGAPFMLSTLAFFLIGITVVVSYLKGKRKFEFIAEQKTLKRDLIFFLAMYSSAVFLPLFFGTGGDRFIAIALIFGYLFYLYCTIRGESKDVEDFHGLHFCTYCNKAGIDATHTNVALIIIQIVASLATMVFGAHMFVKNIEVVSVFLGFSPLIFALLIAPIATELPEKFNSVTWTFKGKDTLAIGNITGAMVFQSTFPVTVGLLFTDWNIGGNALFSAIISIVAGLVALISVIFLKRVSPFVLLFGGVLYLTYLAKIFVF